MTTVTIIICTRNRAEHLRQTLVAIDQVLVPDDLPAELVIVDNGSTDNTEEVVRSYDPRAAPIRYLRESRAGQCYARNTGLRHASGEVILFTDDDVYPGPEWIEEMCRPIHAGQADSVAGRVTMAAHLERPWLRQRHRSLFASQTLAKLATSLVGANMAFSRAVLERVPLFDPELGPGALGFGDDSLFSAQLLRAGYRHTVGSPGTGVVHHFEEDRLRYRSLVESARQRGRSKAYLAYHWHHRHTSYRRLRLVKAYAKLWLSADAGARRHRANELREGIALGEFYARQRIAFLRQLKIEAARPRSYDRHGLRKLRGTLDAPRE